MTDSDRGHPVEVPIGGCRCPGTPRPHADGDVVYLAAKPGLRLGLAARQVVNDATDGPAMAADLGVVYLRYGIVGWNLVGDNGRPLPPTPAAIEARLTWENGGEAVVDAADALYSGAVLDPLVRRLSTSSAPGPTDDSTSQAQSSTGPSSPTSLSPSSPSSPADGAPS